MDRPRGLGFGFGAPLGRGLGRGGRDAAGGPVFGGPIVEPWLGQDGVRPGLNPYHRDNAEAAPQPLQPFAPLAPLAPRMVSASEMLTLRKAVPKFDGKISYEAYRASFDDLVGMYPHLTDEQRFQLLSSGLVGAPLSLLEDLAA